MNIDKNELARLVTATGYSTKIGLCVGVLRDSNVQYFGYNDYKFIYPASVYKLYVAGALLEEVERGRISLYQKVEIASHNAVDRIKEVSTDPRGLLVSREIVQVQYLLDLMITRSDNTAANCLIDLIGRPVINRFVQAHGWRGSEVTRKFLPRSQEDEAWQGAPVTKSSAHHVAEFLCAMVLGQIGSRTGCSILEHLMLRQLDNTKIAAGLPSSAVYIHKTGWYSLEKGGVVNGTTADCGVVIDRKRRYIISCLTEVPGQEGNNLLARIGRDVHSLMGIK